MRNRDVVVFILGAVLIFALIAVAFLGMEWKESLATEDSLSDNRFEITRIKTLVTIGKGYIYRDKETGREYLVICRGHGVAICPMEGKK